LNRFDYFAFKTLNFLNAKVVLDCSGGIQEEQPLENSLLDKLEDNTERLPRFEIGTQSIVGLDKKFLILIKIKEEMRTTKSKIPELWMEGYGKDVESEKKIV